MALHWFGGYVSSFSPHGVFSFGFSYPAVSRTGNHFPVVNWLLLLLHMYVVHVCCWCEAERDQNKPNGLHLSV